MIAIEAPLSIGRVALTVNDLDAVSAFYKDVIGLALISRGGDTALLGAADLPLIEVRQDKTATTTSKRGGAVSHSFPSSFTSRSWSLDPAHSRKRCPARRGVGPSRQ